MAGWAQAKGSSRPASRDGHKENMWSSMLDSVANGKRLPEKSLLVLGGTPESQREFLDTLSADTPSSLAAGPASDPSLLPRDMRRSRSAPIANQFALGYTYQDVLDADHEDTLARVSAYLLSEPSLSFAPLLKPLLTPQSVPETLVVVLLDWSDPWTWVRRLREWVRLLRHVLISLDDETKMVMEELVSEWKDRKRGLDAGAPGAAGLASSGGPVTIPLGPGEWDEGLGVPMCVVCQGADKIETLEKDHGWREEEFDFILQFMRTILLKHGASLVYTTPFLAKSLQSLIHSSLGIHSLLKRESLRHNVIDRDKILVPSNWDSWGKIRIIREGFDMEGVSSAWSIEIQDPPGTPDAGGASVDNSRTPTAMAAAETDGSSAVAIYEQTIRDPKHDLTSSSLAVSLGGGGSGRTHTAQHGIEVETAEMQAFLTQQLEVLEQLKAEDEKDRASKQAPKLEMSPLDDNGRVNEHIGPVQFNMGGIQVDADDMLRKLKEREASRGIKKDSPAVATSPSSATGDKTNNQELANFFQGLVRKPGGSPRAGRDRM